MHFSKGAAVMRRAASAGLFILLGAWCALADAADLSKPLILVARPELVDPFYGATIMVVRPVADGQHLGFIVNRPSEMTLGKLFPDHAASQKVIAPVYLGGPYAPQVLFALVQHSGRLGGSSFEVMPGLFAAFDAALVDRIIETEPQHARFVAGAVAWQPGELAAEVEKGAWYVLEPDAALVLRQPEGLWEELVSRSKKRDDAI
jgi:putative transcriptional regulator